MPQARQSDSTATPPLSFAQQRLWFLDHLEGPNATYNIALALRLDGALDEEALGAALVDVVDRHESLRTLFEVVDDQPRQKIVAPGAVPLAFDRVSGSEAALPDLLAHAAGHCFDLARELPLRASLFRLEQGGHVLLLLLHHIAGDGWSMVPLARDLGTAYGARRAGRAPGWAALPVQYADYTRWQRELLGAEHEPDSLIAEQLAYWKQALAGLPELTTLPLDRPRPALANHRGDTLHFEIDAQLYRRLLALARATRTTLFMLLQAGLAVLLSRMGAGHDIAVGSPIAGRTDDALHDLVGFFANTLVLRTDTSGDPSFTALAARVRKTNLAAYRHQDLPFDRLVEVLCPARSLAHQPLFQVMLVLQNNDEAGFDLPGLTATPQPVNQHVAKFDLSISITERCGAHANAHGLTGIIEYATDLFDRASVATLARRLVRVLTAAVEAPERPISHIDFFDVAERAQLLEGWNRTASPFPEGQPAHRQFEEQVLRTPDACAVETAHGERLSYAVLNARANRLARQLRTRGVGADALVGLCAERSADMVAGVLAILKAGGAYVPLDPAYPADRLAYMLADARPALLLTERTLLDRLPAGDTPVLCFEDAGGLAAADGEANLPDHALPDNLAYVIYTSGTTGRPKGAALAHRGLRNLIHAQSLAFGLAPGQRVLQFASFNFDASIWEIVMALSCGATLCLAERDALMPGEDLQKTLQDRAIGVATLGPVALNLLEPEGLPQLHTVIAAGEACPQALANRWATTGRRLFNGYGPTEATVCATLYQCATGQGSAPPIGRPLPNTQVYILDADLNPQPAGVAGELHIGGMGLARGYLNRPDLSADKFIPDPFGPVPGARLYKSGDLARYLADGNIEYLGRIDQQVKLRGMRVELGEIEAALAAQPGVRDALAIAREDRLYAYVVADAAGESGTQPAVLSTVLRSALAAMLPAHMVPAQIVVMDGLPLTPNGKVDRAALPVPGVVAAEFIAPQGADELAVAAIWSEVLKCERIGAHDNFFALGGHSLLATRAVSKLRAAFGLALPLRAIFEAPTVAALALRLREAGNDKAGHAGGSDIIAPASRHGALLPSFAQQRLWFFDRMAPGGALYNMPLALRLAGALSVEAMARALETIVERHEALRTTFASDDGAPLTVFRAPGPLALPVTDLTTLDSGGRQAEAERLMLAEARAPFDLAAGPLLRAGVLRLAPQEHVLLVTVHHIVSDGWSIGVLMQEMVELYAAFIAGRPPVLAPLPIQYADYAQWQRQWLAGEARQRQIDYWTARLAGAPTLLSLPSDRPRPAVQTYAGALLPFMVDGPATQALHALGQRHQATLFMTLAAAFSVLLARHSGQDDICIGTPIANRQRGEVEGMIGFFVNTLVLRAQVDENASFTRLLEQMRDLSLDAYAHQDMPFEQLVEALKPVRDVSHTPLFQAMLVLQNTPPANPALPGLAMEMLTIPSNVAKFDLTLNVIEIDGRLQASFEYNTDLFDAGTIARLAGHFASLLAAAAAAPDTPVGALPMLTASETKQLLVDWNHTAQLAPTQATTIHACFEARAAEAPDQVAVVVGDVSLSYGELDARAERLARHLRALGVGADVLVAICAERSAGMVVALLAVLKAGGAYVPLDPNYPAERLAYMLADAQPALLLTQSALLDRLPVSLHGAMPHCCIDDEASWPQSVHTGLAHRPAGAGNLAYIIYTSGSSGRPKGVQVAHRSLIDSTLARLDYYGALGRYLLISSLSFDSSVAAIFGVLASGATLVLPDDDSVRDPALLVRLIRTARVTMLLCVPSLWAELARADGADSWTLEKAILAGEACPPELLRESHRRFPALKLFNEYGPTEATVWASVYQSDAQAIAQSASVPIGRPIAGTRIYILDAFLNPVPLGVAGELYIGGAGLTRGYLRQAALSAEKFVPDPFGAHGERMYRTGDLARYLADGNIDYLGRLDEQLKLRGFRIEPGEIEAALLAMAQVRDCVVLARADGDGDRRLVAYLVAQDDALDVGEIRAALARTLPEYMLPAHLVALDKLPRTPNGKVDRKALPAPALLRSDAGFVAAGTPIEHALAAIWADVLGLDRVGIHDSFFELGGNSLLVVRLHGRVKAQFGDRLAVVDLFRYTSVAKLAQFLGAAPQTGVAEMDGQARGEQRRQRNTAARARQGARAA
ncbi:non-ribosomal peptide synthetase [Duganella sp. HH101]|uniref:non-ribosomal peptide synthetase n=1 Tax=Duganella sp. HH101 TaxID=1781066 RepID=UPI000874704D|nr:non-ribosomal peptide synthetase [Duganella sp. HH101]OFA06937.1 linear gramicidin synthase subunit D [Duganella sp. HH101]